MKSVSQYTLGVITAILAIFLFSSKAVIVKLMYQMEVPTVHVLLLRMLLALPFYLFIVFTKKRDSDFILKKQHFLWLILFGVMGYYGASILDFYGLKYLTASLERIILFVYPTIVVVLSAIFLKTKITRVQVVAILVAYVGVFLTFASELNIKDQNHLVLGAVLIFMSAFTYACYLVGSNWLIPKFGAVRFTSLAMIVACCTVTIHYLLTDRTSVLEYPAKVYGYALTMAFFCTVLPSYMVSYAIVRLGASKFSIISSVGPVFTIFLAIITLGEKLTVVQTIGVAIVIVAVSIVSKKEKKSSD
ncbi:DMT family transporter [Wenyingzhuangia sp. IMCC45574]